MTNVILWWLPLLITTFKRCTCNNVRQYYFDITARTWEDARLFCNTSYDGLATIITKNDFTNAVYQIPTMVGHPLTHIWIGLNDRDTESQWRWDDGTPCIFNATTGGHDCSDFWLATQPNDIDWAEDGDCGELWLEEGSFAFNDISCDYVQPVLCNNPLDREYIFDDTFRNFSEAEKFCNRNHGGLATIQTTEEYIKAVQAIPPGVTQALIGLNCIKNDSYWEWSNGDLCINKDETENITLMHDCSPFWAPGEPFNYNDSGHGAHCGQFKYLYSGTWLIKDVPCDWELSVLCTQAVTPHPTQHPLPDIQNDRYVFTTTARTWADSLMYCEKNYIGLATILNMNDLNDAIAVIPKYFDAVNIKHPWIGMTDIKQEGIWEWQDGTQCELMDGTVTHDATCSDLWHDNQPDDWRTNEDCAGLWFHDNYWRFNDAACDQVKTAICLKSYSKIPTVVPTISPTVITSPTERPIKISIKTTNIGMETTTQPQHNDCNTAESSKGTSSGLVIGLIIIIVILLMLLILTTYNMYKYKKIIQSTIGNFSMDQQNSGNQTTEAMDVKLVTNDQLQTNIN